MTRVVVVGGGFSGLSCAVRLASRGARVTVLEARRDLGGRAGSFTDEAGDVVDNGQHLFMACYGATRDFLRALGTEHLVRFQDRLVIDYVQPGLRSRLTCPPLPAPWHLAAGVLTLKGLSLSDRLAFLRAGPALRRALRAAGPNGLEGTTVAGWLDALGQTPALRQRLWHPLAMATLNASPETAPASLLAQVLREGFMLNARDSGLGVATVGLADLYTEASRRFVEQRGGSIRTAQPVTGVQGTAQRITSVRTRDGETIPADAVVLAVPPAALARIESPVAPAAGLDRFGFSPILSVNLWFDRPASEIAPFDFAGAIGTQVQWIFNKERLLMGRASHIATVVSAAGSLIDQPNDALAEMALRDLQACLPGARGARMVRSMVVREKAATYAPTLENEPLRPGPRTRCPNLFLAGDWTVAGIPATIESAVRSGNLCADLIAPAA